MRTIIYTIVFLAVLTGAFFVVDSTDNKLDLPYEAGQLNAPDLPAHGHGDGHGEEAAHGESHG